MLLSPEALGVLSEVGDKKQVWTRGGLAEYLEQDKAVLKALAVLVHLTRGQRARVTELLLVLHEDQNGRQNFFACVRMLYFNIWHIKKNNKSNCARSIQHFLPPLIAQPVSQYLVINIPFKQYLLLKAGVDRSVASTSLLWYKLVMPMSTTVEGA